MVFDDLTCSESERQRVGKATEKAPIPAWDFTMETKNKWKPDERSSLNLGAKERMENRYEGSPEETWSITFICRDVRIIVKLINNMTYISIHEVRVLLLGRLLVLEAASLF